MLGSAMPSPESSPVGQALVEFALHGGFPDDSISSQRVGARDFGLALQALAAAKADLESQVHTIVEETAPDVQSWVHNAQTLEDDINRSRSLANQLVRRAEAPEVSGETIREAEGKVRFLRQEATYNQQVHGTLSSIKRVNELLDQVERARDGRRILESLHLLEQSWTAFDEVPVSKSTRVMKLLDLRAFELKAAVHDVFSHVWNSLVAVDVDNGHVSFNRSLEDAPMSLEEAFIGLKAYKEVDQRMALLWHGVDEAIVGPRTNLQRTPLPGIRVEGATLSISGQSSQNISSLFSDLEKIVAYLASQLPEELIQALSNVMMPDLVPRVISVWLDSAVPVSLKDMGEFQEVISAVKAFCTALTAWKYSGFGELQEWVDNAPRVWLAKCRETSLDSIRTKLSQGLGDAKEVERVETQTVTRSEGRGLAANGAMGDDDDWGAAWAVDDDTQDDGAADGPDHPVAANEEDDGADAWGAWGTDDPVEPTQPEPHADDEDDGADAWGALETDDSAEPAQPEPVVDQDDGAKEWGAWGDEDAADDALQQPSARPKAAAARPQTREVTLKETYNISSMPDPVLALISAILEDGASLVGSPGNPVAAAAAGLFSLPTLILAMFRAVSPYYYSLNPDDSGKMFLYNDATYLSERLADIAAGWKARPDIAPRAVSMLRLDNDIKALSAFAGRAYAEEMSTQRTVLRDLLGNSQNPLQDLSDKAGLEAQLDVAVKRVRLLAATWSQILSRSAWCQAVGALADTLASKLVADVMDLPSIGQEEAYTIASLISLVTSLDDLFLPPGASGEDEEPTTAQYAEGWLRLKYLSEVLQSNLSEVKYLWCESHLSLYFGVEEVVDLIGLSFVDNARTREVVKTIRENPQPVRA